MQQHSLFSPAARVSTAMAYDPPSGRVVLFGGRTDFAFGPGLYTYTPLAETWVWDGASATWTNATPPAAAPGQPATSPPARLGAVMAYEAGPDAEHPGKLVLFGGEGINGALLNDTWSWDGTKWTQEHPAHSPPARWAAVMTENPGSGLVLFGGSQTAPDYRSIGDVSEGDPNEQMLCDTWTWNASDWVQQHPRMSPPARRSASMAYHQRTQTDVLFGGTWPAATNSSPLLGDTWTWDGSSWSQRSLPQAPRPRFGAQMASLPAAGVVVLYDGKKPFQTGNEGDCPPEQAVECSPADTWTWDGTEWTQRFPSDDPGIRAFGSMAYDAPRQRVVLFGGDSGQGTQAPSTPSGNVNDDTWTWDGEGHQRA